MGPRCLHCGRDRREVATNFGHKRWPQRPTRRVRTPDERQSAQFRPLGDHRPAAARAVHAVPESRPAHDLAGHLVLAAAERGRPGPRARRGDPGSGNSRHLRQRHQLPDLRAERSRLGAEALCQGRLDHGAAAAGQRPVVRLAAGVVAAVHRADRRVDLPVAADARGGRQGARLRQVARQAARRKRMAASPSRTSPASTKPSRICRRSSNSCAIRENSSAWADAFRAACCWSARRAPARR